MEEWEFYAAFARNHCTRPLFRGTFARDEIAREKPERGIYIVNTAPRSSPGEHWTLFFVSNSVTYFDSYGIRPLHREYYDFIHPAETFFYNCKRLQGDFSDTCGQYCLYAAALLSCGFSLEDCTRKFSSANFAFNDKLVPVLVNKHYPRRSKGMSCCSLV